MKLFLILGSGATAAGGFSAYCSDTAFPVAMDRNFFDSLITKTIYKPEEYPALAYYQRESSLEATLSKIDLAAKLCLSRVISEEHAFNKIHSAMERLAELDQSYREKLEDEDVRCRVPSMAGWELWKLLAAVFGNVKPSPGQQKGALNKLIECQFFYSQFFL